jgi:excisionase family DNA binding protein
MSKFVPLDEAARTLGVSPEDLVEAIRSNKIHGYRDGSSWKFKEEEIQRFAQDRDAGDSGIDVPDLLGDDEDDESILLSEEGLGSQRGSSTIIGGGGSGINAVRQRLDAGQ